MSRCDLTDLLVTECAHCTGKTLTVAPDVERTFTARFDGPCSNCDGRIRQGDLIGVDSDREYVCTRCVRVAGGQGRL